jgi:hypothetical protein
MTQLCIYMHLFLQLIHQCSIIPLGKLMNFLFQSRNSPHFTLPEDSLQSLQEAIVGRFSEPRVSVNIRPPYSLRTYYNITLIWGFVFQMVYSMQIFLLKLCASFFCLHMQAEHIKPIRMLVHDEWTSMSKWSHE